MKFWKLAVIALFALPLNAQEPGPHDFGRMWTFENPPKEWFQNAYQFIADDDWFDYARKSSLRFATWCSASFVSPNGLLMTNHHCSRGEVGALQREGEDFDKNGFYAATPAEERRAEGLFVEQMVKAEDITDKVNALAGTTSGGAEDVARKESALQQIHAEYSTRAGWENLRLQIVSFYSGVKFSIYGYKRYDDIRLVCIPELDLGYYGGDPDNFTYPRYTLDFTFWRVYDENGNPVNSTANYFKFNEKGAASGEPVFVIGNPGKTERYRTVSQLEYDRDYRYPVQLTFLKNRYAIMAEEYEKNPSDELQEQMFSISNSIKALTGILDGLNNPQLFSRKVAMEKKIRQMSDKNYWDEITEDYNTLGPLLPELQLLSPNPQMMGSTITLLHVLYQYQQAVEEQADEATFDELNEQIKQFADGLDEPEEQRLLATVLSELKMFADPGDTYVQEILDGKTPEAAAAHILKETDFNQPKKLEKLLEKKPKKVANKKDVLFEMTEMLIPKYYDAYHLFQSTGAERRALEEQVVREVFKVYGDDLPPDATFTLRISDGIVKGYEYNGTVAPYMTTFFGLYDRHYSHGQEEPWALPARWSNPSLELLKSPLNFVATTDIVGGNSGSPLINRNHEIVGLAFDGNIESLPGNFIFDEEKNRTVAVHSGAIIASLRYIYKADRLLAELLGNQ